MKPPVFLRIASVLTLVHAVMHTIGGVFGKPSPGAAEVAAATMKANQFPFLGAMRTFWDFHMGLGLAVSIFLTAEAVVFWLLGSVAATGAMRLRPILAVFAVAYLALAVNSVMYFFAVPVAVETLIAVCLALAFFAAKPDRV